MGFKSLHRFATERFGHNTPVFPAPVCNVANARIVAEAKALAQVKYPGKKTIMRMEEQAMQSFFSFVPGPHFKFAVGQLKQCVDLIA